jgi:methyl-accepting chemotaxis protein
MNHHGAGRVRRPHAVYAAVANGVREVFTNIKDVTHAALETETAANQILDATVDLSRQSTTMRRKIDQFLSDVRAA